MTFRNYNDLLRHFEVADEGSLSDAIYDLTECGAWAGFSSRRQGERDETWVVWVRKSIRGGVVIGARRPHGKFVPEYKLPEKLREFFLLRDRSQQDGLSPLGNEFWDNLKADGEVVLRVTRGRGRRALWLWVTVRLPFPVYAQGLAVGSIVEGVEQYAGPVFLRFPFTSHQLSAALSQIEDEAQQIWNETHGCESCAARQGLVWDAPATDNGYVPIDPECPDCKGAGVTI